jgi:hypothetical protein
MEFLMTYGWAILVVLAAIGALAYFGVLSPDKFLPDKCTAAPPFSCTQYKLTSTNVTFTISANAGVDVTPSAITLSCDGTNYAAAATQTPAADAVVPNGNSITVSWSTLPTGCAALSTGNKFKATYNLTYVKSGETVSHATTGSIQARVE